MTTSKLLAGLTLLGAVCAGAQGAAAQGQYRGSAPSDASQAALQPVQITPTMKGTPDPSDSLDPRTAFVAGWSPNQYQFSDAATIAAGTALPLSHLLSNANHGIHAATKLADKQKVTFPISEPASEFLLLAALSALAIVVRRKMPEK